MTGDRREDFHRWRSRRRCHPRPPRHAHHVATRLRRRHWHRRAGLRPGSAVFISPHYYYPWDHDWKFAGTIEKAMHDVGMYDRPDPLDLTGFEGSGADFLDQYKPYIHDGETVVANPHKVYGPENNDLLLQLRKRGIDSVYLCGMSANLCTEAHLREMLEQGFEVTVIKDATAAAMLPDLGDGYAAALTNFKFLANTYFEFRRDLARALIVGLEILVAADIVLTVVVDRTLEASFVLGVRYW
ncbi:MAG: isochorismatase family protein [Acidobacteria bacterium]|nr:isochorismatase family protein [Acidobacteriota bacterium]